MRTVKLIRRENPKRLLALHAGPAGLARRMGKNDRGSTYSQIAGPSPTREVGDRMAAELEQQLGLGAGWMDQDHAGANSSDPVLYSTPAEVRDEVLSLLDKLIPGQQQDLLAHMRALVAANDAVVIHRAGGRLRSTEDTRPEATYRFVENNVKVKP